MSGRDILVYLDHLAKQPELMGVLSVEEVRGRESFAFEFDVGWLKSHPGHVLDPELLCYGGLQYASKSNFGLFMDSAPDRWGRRLMQRREAIRARKVGERAHVLTESDYLLGVYDKNRMGALRFKLSEDSGFVNDDRSMAAPPWTYLRELEEASRRLQDDDVDSEHEKWLAMLLAPGSSLGGARPKASVEAPDGSLWIAKFPKRQDEQNTSAWEYVTMCMARDAGIRVPAFEQQTFSRYGSTFLVKRFDRAGEHRIHFASAMTLLGKQDGASSESGSSYLELAECIMEHSASPDEDLCELWRRIVFSIAVSNTDDHLRNHGFLLTDGGWRLSPAYDLNPNPQGRGLSLNIDDADNALDFDLALEVSSYFRIHPAKAREIMDGVKQVVARWKGYASRVHLGHHEQEAMETAFRW